MSSAGQRLVAGRIPGERIATTIVPTDSSTFTAETIVASVTAPLVSGRTYRVRFHGQFQSSVSGDRVFVRMRQNDISGSTINVTLLIITASASSPGWATTLEAEFVATSTGNKTFVVTGLRASGTGNINLEASGSWPTFLYVDYIRG
jgi:hypothetical protein